MKIISYIKRVMLQITFAALVLPITSCTDNQLPEDTKEVAEKENIVQFDTDKQEKDAQFLVNAAEINMEEIRLGQLAQQKGGTSHVKDLGKMMDETHNKLLKEITLLAKSKTVSIPTSPTDETQIAYETLNGKTGNSFDKAYADLMVEEHKDAIAIFEKASIDCSDVDIKNWATVSLPTLRAHLEHSIECQRRCEKLEASQY